MSARAAVEMQLLDAAEQLLPELGKRRREIDELRHLPYSEGRHVRAAAAAACVLGTGVRSDVGSEGSGGTRGTRRRWRRLP